MKQTTMKDLKENDLFTLSQDPNAEIWIKRRYDAKYNGFDAQRFEHKGSWRFVRPDTTVYTWDEE